MTSLLCRGRNTVADFSFSYLVYSTFHCTPVYIYIYHRLYKDYFIDVDGFLRLNIKWQRIKEKI
jgi:hypothetical protein